MSASGSRRLVAEVDDGVLRLAGEIDIATLRDLDEALGSIGPAIGEPLRIDLSEVTFMDSMGLRSLLRLARERPVRVVDPSPAVRQVLSMAGVADLLKMS